MWLWTAFESTCGVTDNRITENSVGVHYLAFWSCVTISCVKHHRFVIGFALGNRLPKIGRRLAHISIFNDPLCGAKWLLPLEVPTWSLLGWLDTLILREGNDGRSILRLAGTSEEKKKEVSHSHRSQDFNIIFLLLLLQLLLLEISIRKIALIMTRQAGNIDRFSA